MRLPRHETGRLAFPALPFADLALLLLMAVLVAAIFSAVGGVGLRFSPVSERLPGDGETASLLIVAVGANGEVAFDGSAVPPDRLAEAVQARLAIAPDANVLLVVDPAAPYQAAIDAAAPLLREGVLGGRPLSIPNRRQVEELRLSPAAHGRLP